LKNDTGPGLQLDVLKPIENHWSRIDLEACGSVLLNASATHLCRSISRRMAEVFYKHSREQSARNTLYLEKVDRKVTNKYVFLPFLRLLQLTCTAFTVSIYQCWCLLGFESITFSLSTTCSISWAFQESDLHMPS